MRPPPSFLNQSTCWITVWHTYILNPLLLRRGFCAGVCSTAKFSLSRQASLQWLLCVLAFLRREEGGGGEEGQRFHLSCDESLCGGGPSAAWGGMVASTS